MMDKDALLATRYYEYPYQKEKDYLQELYLSLLYGNYGNSAGLVFKGGTALSKFYGLPRFSDDLDFSLVKEANTNLIGDLDGVVEKVSESYSTRILRKTDKKDILAYEISIMGPLFEATSKYQHLKVEVNRNASIMEGAEALRRNPRYLDLRPYVALVMKKSEILAEKVDALLFRHTQKARDLFDICFLLKEGTMLKASLIDKKMREHGHLFTIERLESRIDSLDPVWANELPRLLPRKKFVSYGEAKKTVLEGFTAAGIL